VGASAEPKLKDLKAHVERSKLGLRHIHVLSVKSFPLNDFGKVDVPKLKEMTVAEIARRRRRTSSGMTR
jgi:hypothetical protein